MKELSILLADDIPEWIEALAQQLEKEDGFAVVAKAEDGKKALEQIEKYRPDIVCLDLIMPYFDGAYVVNHIRKNMPGYDPIICMISGIGTLTVITILNELSIDYYTIKPTTPETVVYNLKRVVAAKSLNTKKNAAFGTLEQIVEKYLNDLGVPMSIQGYLYLKEGLLLCLQDENLLQLVSKNLYPMIAKRMGKVGSEAIERGIRHSIAVMKSTNTPEFQKIFGDMKAKVTNSEFLNCSIRYLRQCVEICGI